VTDLDNIKEIEKIDKSGMMDLLAGFPQQCAKAFSIGKDFRVPQPYISAGYKNIVFSGLGGSAIGADLLRSYLIDDMEIPVLVSRDYSPPGFLGRDTLFLACSYSGDTEEVLSSYSEAKRKGAGIIVMTSGGKLATLAKEDGVPVVYIPAGIPPRAALGYSFFGWLDVLSKLGFIGDRMRDVEEAIADMNDFRDNAVGPQVPAVKNPAKKIAKDLNGKYVIIYSAAKHIDSVASRWRGQIEENAKTLASTHIFPEMSHNEIVGWDGPKALLKDFAAVILRDESEHPRVAKRIETVRSMIEKKTKVIELRSGGRNLLSRMFNLIITGDFVSCYLAVLNGADPTPVENIVYLKKELAKLN